MFLGFKITPFWRFKVGFSTLTLGLILSSCTAKDETSNPKLRGVGIVEDSPSHEHLNDNLSKVDDSRLLKSKKATSVNYDPDVFPTLFEGEVSTLAAALGEGPYKVGKPITGYASDFLKEAFDFYDFDTNYTEFLNRDSKVCDFTKVSLFSDEIDLSEFYWHHPANGEIPLQKITTHTYSLKAEPRRHFHMSYGEYYLSGNETRGPAQTLFNPDLAICNLPLNAQWLSHANKHIVLNENIRHRNAKCGTDRDLKSYFKHMFPGSDIGFFFHEENLYSVATYLFDSHSSSPPYYQSKVAIVTYLVKYKYNDDPQLNEKYEDTPKMTELEIVCEFKATAE